MPNCNFNGCFVRRNYPRQIFTCNCGNQRCGGGRVINPEIPAEFGVFEVEGVTVDSGANIPLTQTNLSGTAITEGGGGQVNLTAGNYRVSYNALFVVPNAGQVRTVLRLDGVNISTTESVITDTAGQQNSVSNQIIITVTGNQVLTFVNFSEDAVEFLSANLSIDKL